MFVYGGVYEVFQVVPVYIKRSGVGVSLKESVTVDRHVLFDRV